MKEISHTLQGGVQILGILYDVTTRADSLQTLSRYVCVEERKTPFHKLVLIISCSNCKLLEI